jgi:hypothetical protein
MTQLKTLLRARDAFYDTFAPQLEGKILLNLSVGIRKIDDKFALAVRCQVQNLRKLSNKQKKEVLEILGTSFTHGGVDYRLDIKFMGIPRAQ